MGYDNTNKGAMTLPFQKLGPNIVFNLLPTRGNIKCSTRTIQLHSERARHSPTNKKSLIISQRMKVCQRAELITSSPVKRKRQTQQSRSKPVYTTKGKRPKHKTEYEPWAKVGKIVKRGLSYKKPCEVCRVNQIHVGAEDRTYREKC